MRASPLGDGYKHLRFGDGVILLVAIFGNIG